MIACASFLRNLFVGAAALGSAWAWPAWPGDVQPAYNTGLADYVARPDESFEWREVASGRIGSAEYVEYLMTSQTWLGIVWKHQLFVLRPKNMPPDARQALLFIHSGRWKPEYEDEGRKAQLPSQASIFVRLAEEIGAPVGVLRQVPFQPLFNRREDALIAYSFEQYLQTGERDWPLLLPMVKSAVRAMDVMQRTARDRWNAPIDYFTVAGASKRGWTAWLTAATDPRVMAVVPMVIDLLNIPAQMDHQRSTWGDLSEQIQDYAALDLPSKLRTPRGEVLLSMVDPFSYRERLDKPKLILLSTNDRYWPLDALNLYWRELPGPKHVLYIPNQGHELRDIKRVIGGVSAAHRYAAAGRPLPQTSWFFSVAPEAVAIRVEADRPVQRVLIWSAKSPTLDFREAHWTSRKCPGSDYVHSCSAPRAPQGYTATYAETWFGGKDEPSFSTTTTICIVRGEKTGSPGASSQQSGRELPNC